MGGGGALFNVRRTWNGFAEIEMALPMPIPYVRAELSVVGVKAE